MCTPAPASCQSSAMHVLLFVDRYRNGQKTICHPYGVREGGRKRRGGEGE